MVRRRSTVRFRNGAPLKDQVRSSLDSCHLTLWMGAVAVLGGIWEIVFLRAISDNERARLGGERAGRMAHQDGGRQRWSYSRQPWLVRFTASVVTYMSSLTSASILKLPIPSGAPGSSTRCMALQVGQKSPWAMPLHSFQFR